MSAQGLIPAPFAITPITIAARWKNLLAGGNPVPVEMGGRPVAPNRLERMSEPGFQEFTQLGRGLELPYKRKCRETFPPSPQGDAGTLADIQPPLIAGGLFSTPSWPVTFYVAPSQLFHEAAGSDASRFLKLHKRRLANLPTTVLWETQGLWLS